jgi:phytoene dehydrogenase-like protein
VGGQAATETFGEGFEVDVLHAGGQLRPDIVNELDLARYGLPATRSEPLISLLPDGRELRLTADTDGETLASIGALSKKDAERWPDFIAFMREATGFLDEAYRTPMPRLPHVSWKEGAPLARLALKLRGFGARDMFRVIRALPMSALELTEEWFESDSVRAALGAVAVHGSTLGPMSAGSGYTLMHNWLNRGGPGHKRIEGGVGRIADALAAALKARGGQLRTLAEVKTILQDDHRVRGVKLASGEEIAAPAVVSGADPRATRCSISSARRSCRPSSSGIRSRSRCAARLPRCIC